VACAADLQAVTDFCDCVVLLHPANAAMPPLVGQKLALADRNQSTALMSGCIVAAQCVMVPIAILVGRKANFWGRNALFSVRFRGGDLARRALHAVRRPLVAVVGTGVRWRRAWALWGTVPADCRRPDARHPAVQCQPRRDQHSARNRCCAVGRRRRGMVALAGYSAAFLLLAGIAAASLALFWIVMPETRPADEAA